ncbi:MAG: transposase [Bacillota bacterium]
MYDSQYGRPNFPVKILVSLEILKHQFDLSDRELLDRFRFDARYIKALGLNEVGQLTLGERTLYDFRERLLDYIKETGHDPLSEVFDELVANFIEITDLATDIQCMDSTMVKANIKHLSRIQLMRKVLDNLVKELLEYKRNQIHKNILITLDDDSFRSYLNKFDKEEIRDSLLGKLNSLKLLFKTAARLMI